MRGAYQEDDDPGPPASVVADDTIAWDVFYLGSTVKAPHNDGHYYPGTISSRKLDFDETSEGALVRKSPEFKVTFMDTKLEDRWVGAENLSIYDDTVPYLSHESEDDQESDLPKVGTECQVKVTPGSRYYPATVVDVNLNPEVLRPVKVAAELWVPPIALKSSEDAKEEDEDDVDDKDSNSSLADTVLDIDVAKKMEDMDRKPSLDCFPCLSGIPMCLPCAGYSLNGIVGGETLVCEFETPAEVEAKGRKACEDDSGGPRTPSDESEETEHELSTSEEEASEHTGTTVRSKAPWALWKEDEQQQEPVSMKEEDDSMTMEATNPQQVLKDEILSILSGKADQQNAAPPPDEEADHTGQKRSEAPASTDSGLRKKPRLVVPREIWDKPGVPDSWKPPKAILQTPTPKMHRDQLEFFPTVISPASVAALDAKKTPLSLPYLDQKPAGKRCVTMDFFEGQKVISNFPGSPTRRSGTLVEVKRNAVGVWVGWTEGREGRARDWVLPKDTVVMGTTAPPAKTLNAPDPFKANVKMFPYATPVKALFKDGNEYRARVIEVRQMSPPLRIRFVEYPAAGELWVNLEQVKWVKEWEENAAQKQKEAATGSSSAFPLKG